MVLTSMTLEYLKIEFLQILGMVPPLNIASQCDLNVMYVVQVIRQLASCHPGSQSY